MTAARWILALVLAGVALLMGAVAYLKGPTALAFAGSDIVALADYRGANPTGVPADIASADPVARGRYLTQAADCQACHTQEGGTPFAGGRPFRTPFGTLYSTNLTPDRDTGLGAWSAKDFLRAVHEGVRPDGAHLYPAFPYAAYTYLTDEDVQAMWTYLQTLPAVRAPTPANDLVFPVNQRALMGIWSALFNPGQRFTPNPRRSAEWNRGAYLAEALAHCGECHTPRNLLQALNERRKYAGALTNGWQAYNITAAARSGLGAWSDAELTQYLATGHAPQRGTAAGPMGEAIELSLSKLTAGDLHALVSYLRSIPPLEPATPASGQSPQETASSGSGPAPALGQQVFAGACAGCHDWSGTNPAFERASLRGARSVNDPSAVNVVQIVLHGSPGGAGAAPGMPAFGGDYSDEEIAAVANFVTGRFGAKPSSVSPAEVTRLRTTS
ncbi:MAG: cytochrome c [Gammaproteobacteria bacterium]|nr:cytochrome c [Gammaproteobacteria bacterium]